MLILVGAVATIWLAAIGKLDFYIHPRYTIFTVSLAGLALVIIVASIATGRPSGHDHAAGAVDHVAEASQRLPDRLLSASRVVLLVCAVLAMLVIPPATLSARIRGNRDLVTSSQGIESGGGPVLAGADPATFTVKDWAALLREGGAGAVTGQHVALSGYVLDRGEDDTFYLVRLMMTCCAVDAQPVGVPVARPGWRKELRATEWVAVKGTFGENPDQNSRADTVVVPEDVAKIDEPAEPYVF